MEKPDITIVFSDIFCEFEKNFISDSTSGFYIREIREFENTAGKNILMARNEDVLKYYEYLKKRVKEGKITGSTMTKKFRYLNSFCSYAYEHGDDHGLVNYVNHFEAQLPFLYKDEKLVKTVPIKDIDRLFSAAKEDAMAYSILTLILRMGLISSEICKLKYSHFKEYENGIFLFLPDHDYGKKVPEDVWAVLDNYMGNTESNEYVFLNSKGNPLNYMYISRIMKKYCEKAGIEHISAEKLRNVYGVILYNYRVPLDIVMQELNITNRHIARYADITYREELSKSPEELVSFRVVAPDSGVRRKK